MLRAEGLRKRFGARTAVDGISLAVERGETVGLLGPNGAGKTVTFSMIVGSLRPEAGRIWIDDVEVTGKTMADRAHAGLGYLTQERSLFRHLSVVDNLRLILEMRSISTERKREMLRRLIEQFALEPLLRQRADSLSGGQQRRVEVARALVTEPSYLLLDEPFAGIDPLTVADLQRMIAELRSRNYGILVTDHNVVDTLRITDRAYVIHDGRVIAIGTPDQITADPLARAVFFGQRFRYES
ncbi:LPS export ABC transporter ATP-binding protein [bacterium]|nr:MAG: LPS export ABC transporter ATP-binding protein [bacterium]